MRRETRIPAVGARRANLTRTVRHILCTLAGIGALMSTNVKVEAGGGMDLERAAELTKVCASCHGESGQGNARLEAPAIAGLPAWYVEAQLEKFRKSVRGAHPDDLRGLQMRPMARQIYTDADVKNVAVYVSNLAPVRPAITVDGNVGHGKTLYQVCVACHGEKGQGNDALKAPPLQHLNDWYIVSQLGKFKAGIRGVHKDDVTGASMRPMALTLSADQDVKDVAAYIATFNPKQPWE